MAIPVQKVAPGALRKRFNDGRYWERAQSGEFQEVVLADGHPSPPLANEQVCTRSQSVAYIDNQGRQVAEVHQYVRRDGTIGASGKPDPKRLYEKGVLYVVRRSRTQSRYRKRKPRGKKRRR